MKRICVLASIIAGLAAGALFAQSDSDYQTWMKAVAASNGSLQKGIAAKVQLLRKLRSFRTLSSKWVTSGKSAARRML